MMADRFGDIHFKDRLSIDVTVANAMRYNRFKGGHPAGFIEAFSNYYHDVATVIKQSGEKNNILSVADATEGLRLCSLCQPVN